MTSRCETKPDTDKSLSVGKLKMSDVSIYGYCSYRVQKLRTGIYMLGLGAADT
jgi:hypothetical protein